ncbi:MAG: M48 family metallopeptidase [Campylobacteraceae bacterium]
MRIFLVAFLSVFILTGCVTSQAPITGRTQLILIDSAQEKTLGLSASEEILQSANKSKDVKLTNKIIEIGKKIVAVSPEASAYEWSFYLIEEDTINAFALPGGQVFFYTGILKLMSNDDQIATVMGHEIAHVLAHHGAERMSHQMLSNIGSQVLSTALEIPAQYQGIYDAAYGVATNVGVILPFSRKHESEADKIGIYLMYKAGYNPNEAIKFWQKMSEASGGATTPEFLSTHPADATRIKDIEAYIKTLQ